MGFTRRRFGLVSIRGHLRVQANGSALLGGGGRGMHEWLEWGSGDCVHAPDRPGAQLDQSEVLRRVAVGFRRVVIDWPAGERWAEARAAKAEEFGYRGFLLEAERALRDES